MFELEKLPFSFDNFDKLSAKSFEIHYLKHHATYLNNLNNLLNQYPMQGSLEEIILTSYSKAKENPIFKSIFNNAAQHWNHSFFWKSLSNQNSQNGLLDLIDSSFGSLKNFKDKFVEVGLKHFGSGWVWIVITDGVLEIIATSNADNPLIMNKKPLLVCDIWEHAYYVDFLNDRKEFLSTIFDYFNWEFACKNK